MTRRARGFSLIEMAFVLVIVTLLLGGLLVPFATQVEQKRIAETQKAMEEIKEALLGYALSHTAEDGKPRLPCADTNNDGEAEPLIDTDADGKVDQCPPTAYVGWLPYATLGVVNADGWGDRFRYQVSPEFAALDKKGFTLETDGTLRVCLKAGCPSGSNIATDVPVVIVSHGKNGFGAISGSRPANDTTITPCPNCSPDENENQSVNNLFVSRVLTPVAIPLASCGSAGQPLCEFDDLVTWLSPNVLFNRMVAAGQLP